MLSFLMGMARQAWSVQNNKDADALSLQYLKKELNYKVDVLHAYNHESLLEVDFIFDEFRQVCPQYPGKFTKYLWHLKK